MWGFCINGGNNKYMKKKIVSILAAAAAIATATSAAFLPIAAGATAGVEFSFLSNLQGQGAPNYLGTVSQVTVDGGYAYTSSDYYDQGLDVVDISNPSTPTFVAHVPFTGTVPGFGQGGIGKSGDFVFVSAGYTGIWVVDASDPTSPTVRPAILSNGGTTFTRRLAVQGSYLYAINNWGGNLDGLRIVDVSNPLSPVLMGFVSFPVGSGGTNAVTVSGNRLYFISETGTFSVVDISDPSSPAVLGTLPGVGLALSMEVVGNYAYFVNNSVLKVVDVSSPASPALVASIPAPSYVSFDVARLDPTTLVFTISGDMVVTADISNPTAPVFGTSITGAGAPNYLGGAMSIAVSGGKAYVAARSDASLTVLSIVAPSPTPPPGEVVDTVHDGVLKLNPGQDAVLRPPAVLNGGLVGTGDNTVTIEGNVQADGSVKNILNLHLTAGSTLTITGGLEVKGTLIIDAGAILIVGGKFTCPGATNITNNGSTDIGNNQCLELTAKAGGSTLAIYALVALASGFGIGVFMKARKVF